VACLGSFCGNILIGKTKNWKKCIAAGVEIGKNMAITHDEVDKLCYRFNKYYHNKIVQELNEPVAYEFDYNEIRIIYLALTAAKARLRPDSNDTEIRKIEENL
jgi:hypothetical protein